MSIHFHKLIISEVRKETSDCISVTFEVPGALQSVFSFRPGQNVTVRASVNSEEIRRSYSICSAPHQQILRIAIKETPGGRFSAWANRELVKGHALEVLPPTGSFTIVPDAGNRKNYLAIAAGSGITPVLSIITAALHAEPLSTFTLIYGNRSRASIIFREELNGLKNRYMHRFALHYILSRELPDAPVYAGRIDAAKCEALGKVVDYLSMDGVYICGPGPMIVEVSDWLKGIGVEQRKIHFELFTTPESTALQAATSATHNIEPPKEAGVTNRKSASAVTVRLDGLSVDFTLPYDDNTILDAALNAGADLPYSCKGGVCGTCRGKLIEGKVEMDLNYALEPEEVEAGFILCCQARPVTEKVVIDFDDK